MTTDTPPAPVVIDAEDALQAVLDAHPDSWQTRLVLADLLDERRDPRAAGYRALGRMRRVPVDNRGTGWGLPGFCSRAGRDAWADGEKRQQAEIANLPDKWWESIPCVTTRCATCWRCRDSRREIEDAAALAYRPEFEEPTS